MVLSDFKNVKVLVLDVDGVLTDNRILVNEHGEQWRSFHVRDGFAIKMAIKVGFPIWVITGGKSKNVELRLRDLGIEEIFSGVFQKSDALLSLCEKYQIDLADVAYIGDDIPDVFPLQKVGLPICPADAVPEVVSVCSYVSPKQGGDGVVREVLEKILKLQDKWHPDQAIRNF